MSRLFISPRELDFISDITKELIKDLNGQKIIYFPISELKTLPHDVYNEAIQKFFDQPISIDALVDAQFQGETTINQFGIDAVYKIEAFIQFRDLVDKGISMQIGDFFSYGTIFYEVTQLITMKTIWGLAEHRDGIKVVGTKARETLFRAKVFGPTNITHTDADAVQQTFVQQRGFAENSEGKTGDKRDLIEKGVLDPAPDGPREVSPKGGAEDNSTAGSAFYDE